MAKTSPDVEKSQPFPLSAIDRNHLSLADSEFQPHTWEELKQIIARNDLDVLKRWPSDLRRYIKWSGEKKIEYGSMPNYIQEVRLKWTLISGSAAKGPVFECKSPVPFEDVDDYKILPNDWPYGLESGISHIIVWLKNRLESEPVRGDLAPASRARVETFVKKKFTDRVQNLPGHQEKILWFRNWTALQSVPGMEHVHILVRDVPQDIILEWTEGEATKQD